MSRFTPYERPRYKRFKGFHFPEVDLNYEGDSDSPPWRPGRVGDLVRPVRTVKTENVEKPLRGAQREPKKKESYTAGPVDEVSGQRPAFPVSQKRPNVKNAENEPPLTVEDYLSSVREETSKLPKVKYVPRDPRISIDTKRQDSGQKDDLQNKDDPKQNDDSQDSTRKEIPQNSTQQDSKQASKGEVKISEVEPSEILEESTNAAEPEELFTVNIEWHRGFMKQFKGARAELAECEAAGAKDDTPVEWPVTMSQWREFLNKSRPTLSLLSKLDKTTATNTLPGYLCKWLSPHVSEALSQWVFAIFIKIPETVLADEMSELRRMAKKAIRLRKQTEDMTSLYTIDMVVSIVAGFYFQYDLVSNLPQ